MHVYLKLQLKSIFYQVPRSRSGNGVWVPWVVNFVPVSALVTASVSAKLPLPLPTPLFIQMYCLSHAPKLSSFSTKGEKLKAILPLPAAAASLRKRGLEVGSACTCTAREPMAAFRATLLTVAKLQVFACCK